MHGEPLGQSFGKLARGWIGATEGGRGDGWEPYALATRAIHWTEALLLFGDGIDAETRERVGGSLWRQLAVLEQRLERHLLANHLQRDLQALAVGGLLFGGADAARWRTRGARGLWRELHEQVLPDGGHFERSPMYHAVALDDYLRAAALLRAGGEAVPGAAEERLRRMTRAFGVFCRPDGALHLFNDAAQGDAPERAELDALARRVLGQGVPAPEGALELRETGYFGWAQPGGGTRLLVDCGIPGPAYQPGHAHCDVLSYELDLDGRPVVVDLGLAHPREAIGDEVTQRLAQAIGERAGMTAGMAAVSNGFARAQREMLDELGIDEAGVAQAHDVALAHEQGQRELE